MPQEKAQYRVQVEQIMVTHTTVIASSQAEAEQIIREKFTTYPIKSLFFRQEQTLSRLHNLEKLLGKLELNHIDSWLLATTKAEQWVVVKNNKALPIMGEGRYVSAHSIYNYLKTGFRVFKFEKGSVEPREYVERTEPGFSVVINPQ